MKKIMIIAVAMSVGIWSQYAVAAGYYDIGTPLPADVLAANHCTSGSYQGGCRDPLYWNSDYGYSPEDCNDWMVEFSCTACQPGYSLEPYTCIPNNELGTFISGCMPSQMTEDEKNGIDFVYTCRCSSSFSETGKEGYLFRGDCYSGSIEFKCDASNKYYQTSTSTAPTCTVSTDSSGNSTFSRCRGCSKCNEETTSWKAANTGYQRAYKKKFTDGTPSTCTDVNLDKWRCASGYYGTSTNGTSGCNACPSFESVGLTKICNYGVCPYVESEPGSNTKITDCVASTYELDLDVYLQDATGTFHWVPVDDTINPYGECNWQ